jgi:hypothetical protein
MGSRVSVIHHSRAWRPVPSTHQPKPSIGTELPPHGSPRFRQTVCLRTDVRWGINREDVSDERVDGAQRRRAFFWGWDYALPVKTLFKALPFRMP